MTIKTIVSRWLDAALPHRQGPQIGKVVSFNSGSGANRYSAKVRILKSGNLEETETILDEVPMSPIWASSNGAGVYAPLPNSTLVIIDYIDHNPAYPFILGVWGEFYEASDFASDEFLITNGTISITVKEGELCLNGSDFGGLIKKDELVANLNKNVEVLSILLGVLQGAPVLETGSGAPSNLQGILRSVLTGKNVGDFSKLENKTVKHG